MGHIDERSQHVIATGIRENRTAVGPVSPRRSVTLTELARRSFDQPAILAPIMANASMCCVVARAATSTEQMAPTYGCDGARHTTEEHRASHFEWQTETILPPSPASL